MDGNNEDTVALISGGRGVNDYYDGYDYYDSSTIYPPSSGCSLPPSHGHRRYHALFTTLETRPRIASCGGVDEGGYSTASCLVFDQETQAWENNIMSDLVHERENPAVVSLNNIGTFMIGGSTDDLSDPEITTDFLAQGSLQWVAGPRLPLSMLSGPCAVQISPVSFLVIRGHDIREYLVNVDNPVSDDGWQDGTKWPRLKTWRHTLGQNRSFWLLKRFLIFQGISGDLDVNLLKHITMKIQ